MVIKFMPLGVPPNGVRYPRVGGRRQRHFTGTSFEPRKLLENAQTPTRRVHAVLARLLWGGENSFAKLAVFRRQSLEF